MSLDKSKTNSVAVGHKDSQWRSPTAEKATQMKGRLLDQVMILFNHLPLQNRNFS